MSDQPQYIIDEQGKQIGVVLNIEHYQHLRTQIAATAEQELLAGMSEAELFALAESVLAPSAQQRLNLLLDTNTENQLSDAESNELDHLLAQVDQLTILKTRARYTLSHRKTFSAAA